MTSAACFEHLVIFDEKSLCQLYADLVKRDDGKHKIHCFVVNDGGEGITLKCGCDEPKIRCSFC